MPRRVLLPSKNYFITHPGEREVDPRFDDVRLSLYRDLEDYYIDPEARREIRDLYDKRRDELEQEGRIGEQLKQKQEFGRRVMQTLIEIAQGKDVTTGLQPVLVRSENVFNALYGVSRSRKGARELYYLAFRERISEGSPNSTTRVWILSTGLNDFYRWGGKEVSGLGYDIEAAAGLKGKSTQVEDIKKSLRQGKDVDTYYGGNLEAYAFRRIRVTLNESGEGEEGQLGVVHVFDGHHRISASLQLLMEQGRLEEMPVAGVNRINESVQVGGV